MEIAKNIENYFRIEILLKRNKRMAQRVIELLNSNFTESFFFVFGAGLYYYYQLKLYLVFVNFLNKFYFDLLSTEFEPNPHFSFFHI